MPQTIISGEQSRRQLAEILQMLGARKLFLVCGSSFDRLPFRELFENIGTPYVRFSGFTSDPVYEDVCRGVDLFRQECCDTIVAVGGGSAIDVAKCVRQFSVLGSSQDYLRQEYRDSRIPMIAIPTTAGTGSESTHFAVVYKNGRKYSVAHGSMLPDYVILDADLLRTLPLYQKKCTLLDALCQAIESWWSVKSTEESIEYSKQAIELILQWQEDYIQRNSREAAEKILQAANYSGRAINITQTTAPHAMSYKLTSLYRLPHGHAVALCLPEVWDHMSTHPEQCVDPRGEEYVQRVLLDIAHTMGGRDSQGTIERFRMLLQEFGIDKPMELQRQKVLEALTKSVDPARLGNNPIKLDEDTIMDLYRHILKVERN